MRYVLAMIVMAMATEVMAEGTAVSPILRNIKQDDASATYIVEDVETGCQTIIMLGGNFLSVNGLSIPRLTAEGKPWCRNTAPQ